MLFRNEYRDKFYLGLARRLPMELRKWVVIERFAHYTTQVDRNAIAGDVKVFDILGK